MTSDLASGLTNCICKDGQSACTARIPFANGINSTLATDATNTTTGSILTAGGAGIVKALWVGGLTNIAGALTLQSTLAVTGHATLEGVTSTGATGTGALVFATSPTLVTPVIGAATGTSLALGTNPASTGTLRVPNNSPLTARNAANAGDVNLIYLDTSDRIVLGTNALLASSIGVFGTVPPGQQASGANLTNNVTVGGTTDTIADFTSLSVYATDAAAIRNDIYQLARKLKQINDGLRAYGLFT